ncbi:hypothetical protein BJV82DRAFT_708648 [Fennellomyces sp. T-0311]|nr:hypothetical protein BJV82DRAFT_708648 [Fennellomyces sp. T-0311]
MAKKIIALTKGNEAPEEPKQTGRPKKVLTEEYIHAMCKFALNRVKAGGPVTVQLLQDHLKDESFERPCPTVLKEDMKKAGLRGSVKTTLVVKTCPSKPRCFSMNRTVTLITMLKGPSMFLASRDVLYAKLRQTQAYSRSSLYEKHTKAVEELARVCKNAKVAPDYNDYHGNFNAVLLERLFERLCKKVEDLGFECTIHIDGAKYHFRNNDRIPTSQAKRQEIIDCLSMATYGRWDEETEARVTDCWKPIFKTLFRNTDLRIASGETAGNASKFE